ncbi:MAG: hypothetical protein IK066_07970, partial [Kiritimatiellae bacterium]|nr:hypothetical protein [Kiritimatiellia bacterium]
MKTSFRLPIRFALALAAAAALAPFSASADARLRVVADSAPVHARPDTSSPVLSTAPRDAILFPSGAPEGLWTPVDPPADAALWLPAEFVDGSRVLARSVPLRTGPGLEHDVAGTLSRNATVMRLGESGDWLKIAPPSSARLWVRTADVAPVAESSEPIRDVEPVAALPIAPPSSTFLVGQTPPITPSVPTPDAPAPI